MKKMRKIFSVVITFALLFSIIGQAYAAEVLKPYSEKTLGWSINILPELTRNEGGNANEASFTSKDQKSGINVHMYTKAGMTLDSWVNKELKEIKANCNSNYLKILKVDKAVVNKAAAKKLYTKIKIDKEWITQCSMYIVGKNYRYNVIYSMSSSDFDAAAKKARMEGAISSFKFTEPKAGSVGNLAEKNKTVDSAKRNKIEDKVNGWVLDLPDTWEKSLDLDKIKMYSSINKEMIVAVTAAGNVDGKTLEDCLKGYEEENKLLKIVSKKNEKLNGYDCVSYTLEDDSSKVYSHVIVKNDIVYVLSIGILHYADVPQNVKLAQTIASSFKITEAAENIEGNSIKDYASLLKGSTKDKIGDSYYNWSFTAPKKRSVTERTFNGESTLFSLDSGKSYFSVLTYKNEKNMNLDAIMADLLDKQKNGYSLVLSEKRTKDNREYGALAYKADKDGFVNDYRVFISGDRLYFAILSVSEEEYTKKTYASTLDSFDVSFIKDGKTEDLSDVNKDGCRTYKSRKLNWSIDTMPEWSEYKSDNKDNSVGFTINENSSTYVEMYSCEQGLTLSSWVDSEYERLNRVLNKQLAQISAPEDIVVNGVNYKRINATIKTNYDIFHESYLYAVGKNYRYEFGYTINDATFKDAVLREKVENSIKSFSFKEPDSKLVGKLVDAYRINQSDSTRTITSTKYNWSVKLPVSFIASDDNNDNDVADYTCNKSYVGFSLSAEQAEGTLDEYAAEFSQIAQKHTAKYSVSNTETLNIKGTIVKKFTYRYADSDKVDAYNNILYILIKNGNVYHVYFSVKDVRFTDYSTDIMNKVWDSMTF